MNQVHRYTVLARDMAGHLEGQRLGTDDREVVMAHNYDALAQQLAASQARYEQMFEQSEKTLSRVHMMYAKRLLEATGERQDVLFPDEEMIKWFEQIKEQQATITRLEAMIAKALDLDYQRRQEIAEAVGLLSTLRSQKWNTTAEWQHDAAAYLAAHEEKENE